MTKDEFASYLDDHKWPEERRSSMTAQAPQAHIKEASATADATVVRRAVFTLDEGDVVIEFPRALSKESVDDLAGYLDTFMKRARRGVLAAGLDHLTTDGEGSQS